MQDNNSEQLLTIFPLCHLKKADESIGLAIRESGIPRSELFISTKFPAQFAAPENVELCLDLSLKALGLDYVDLYVAQCAHAIRPISREALEKAVAHTSSSAERGILTFSRDGYDGHTMTDWEHTSGYLAKLAGISSTDHDRSTML